MRARASSRPRTRAPAMRSRSSSRPRPCAQPLNPNKRPLPAMRAAAPAFLATAPHILSAGYGVAVNNHAFLGSQQRRAARVVTSTTRSGKVWFHSGWVWEQRNP